jgi:outer membrane scaffolding protein for murein synthesis (MipA/OmpV family)
LSLPNYRGSAARRAYVLPMPYLVYRGETLKMDSDGLRGLLLDSERVELNVSLNGSLHPRSDDDPLRQGMADLDPTVEFGPTLNVHLWRSSDRRVRLDARAPLRTAVTVAPSPTPIGWLFSPNLLLEVRDPRGWPGWNFSAQAGPYFNDRRYNSYFYGVRPREATPSRPAYEATPSRPAYEATGGYAGTQVTLTLSRRFAGAWLGAFVRHDSLAAAVIEDSPLVRRSDALSAGFALAWIFRESERRVAIDD